MDQISVTINKFPDHNEEIYEAWKSCWTEVQENELQFLIATVLIASIILPIKYIIYKFFVFKDSLES